MERSAADSRVLVLLGAACVLSGLVAWGSYEAAPASTRAPMLELYLPPVGLRPMAAPGLQTAPVAPPSVMTRFPGAEPPSAPEVPRAPPSVMIPFTVDSPEVQMPIGQPFMDTAPQTLPLAAEPSKTEAFMMCSGLAAYLVSVAIGVTLTRKRINVFLQTMANSLGGAAGGVRPSMTALPGRAGVLTMMADAPAGTVRPALAPVARAPTNAITMRGGRTPVKLLTKLEKLGAPAALAESGLLSGLEGDGAFSTLEKLGAFSTLEKTLPVVQGLGVLSLMEASLDVEAWLLFLGASLLVGLGPIYAALAINDYTPTPEGPVFAAAVAGFGLTTVLGTVLFAWAFAVSKLQED